MDPEKVQTTLDWETPTSVKEVQSFLIITDELSRTTSRLLHR